MSTAHLEPDELEKDEVATKAWDSAVLRRLWRFARPHWGKFVACFGVLGVLFFLELAAPWMLKSAIDGPVSAGQAARNAAEGGEFDPAPFLRVLGLWALGYVVVIAITAFTRGSAAASFRRPTQGSSSSLP